MNLVLVLRAELVCLLILLYLIFVSRTYRMGKDVRIFNLILLFAVAHVVMDGVTVWTVNYLGDNYWNHLAHIIFYLSAILFSYEMCMYTLNLTRPQPLGLKIRLLVLLPTLVYLVLLCTPLMTIEYEQLNGTKVSVGSAAVTGYVIAFAYFAAAIISIFVRWKKIGKHFKRTMLPMLFLLIVSELIQTQVKEFLFTGCAIAAITVAFFFTLENPAAVLERKVMMDALSGLGTRSGYEHDMAEFEQEFEMTRDARFTFMFIDINNLRSVNGLYGHQEGDSYISSMAVLLMTNLRGAAHIYRMGGDEFLVIYRNEEEKTVIRDIRRVHEACAKSGAEKGYMPELAIGYAVSDPKYNSLRDVLRVADYMMYRNKADLKREIAEDAIHHTGTRLNLSGLTDRVFDAMCLTSEEYYPYLTNLETYVTRVAPAMVEYFGLESEFLNDFAQIWQDRVHPDDLAEYVDDISATLSGRKQYHFCRYRVKDRNGEYVQVTCRGGVYHGRDGEPDVFAGYLVNHGAVGTLDAITGLRNHHVMLDRINETIREKKDAVVVALEVRNYNRIKLVYGNEKAPTLLRALADMIQKLAGNDGEVFSTRESNSFVLLLPDCSTEKANDLYRQIRASASNGLIVGDEVVAAELFGGAVSLPHEALRTAGEIRQASQFAVDEAAAAKLNNLRFFGGTGEDRREDNRELLRTIQHDCVMDRTRFYLRYQPIMDAQTGAVTGAEALLRWKSDEAGEVSPTVFIPFLENDPAYEPLGYDIIRAAVRQAKAFREKLPDFRINVNITAIQLLKEDFIDKVGEILTEEQYEASGLVLELTERCKEMEFNLLKERVEELKATGIRVALDDMGTGFSTLDLLLHLPVNEIKLDMAFTGEIRENETSEELARTLCHAAARGGMDVCFEGVETEEMFSYLKGYGSVLLQGYWFDKPLTAEEFSEKYCE